MTIKQAFCFGLRGPLFVGVRFEHEREGARTFIVPVEADKSEETLLAELRDEWGEGWEVELIKPEGLGDHVGCGIELCTY